MGDEDQLVGLGFSGWFDFPVGVALDFFEACSLEVVEDFPVGEKSYAFVVSEHVCTVLGFYYACFVPPGYAVHSVVDFDAVNVNAAYSSGTCFINVVLCRTYHSLILGP